MDKNFSSQYDFGASIRFLRRWGKLLTVVFVVAAIVSLIVSLLITPLFKSTAVLIPTASNRLSKAILAERYSHDFMDYGHAEDCEYAIQLLLSRSMEEAVCKRFNLMTHYDIDTNSALKETKLHSRYEKLIGVKRTEYMGVQVTVKDSDPEMAAAITNYMLEYYDTLCNRVHYDRARDAAVIMQSVVDSLTIEVYKLEADMKANPSHALSDAQLHEQLCSDLATMQTRLTETRVDLNKQVHYKYWVDRAVVADKKAYPKRSLVTLGGAFGTLIMCVLLLLLVEAVRRERVQQSRP